MNNCNLSTFRKKSFIIQQLQHQFLGGKKDIIDDMHLHDDGCGGYYDDG